MRQGTYRQSFAANGRIRLAAQGVERWGAGMVKQILVPFEGEGFGVEDLTWGQIGFWEGMYNTGQSATMGGITADLPPGTGIDEVAEGLAFVVGRHQSLRTRLRFEPDGRVRQVCESSGQIPIEIVDAGDGDPDEVAETVRERYSVVNFDYEHEWPVRTAVIMKGGELCRVVTVYLHLAVDATGMDLVLADLASRDPETGAAAGPVTAVQPLEQARQQRAPAALRRCAASLRYLEHVFRTMTPQRFGEPKYPEDPGFRQIRFRSPATALAVRRIAEQENTNTSSVLLACFAVGVARHTRNSLVMAFMLVNNRFRPGFAESVSPLVQLSPYLIDVADATLGEAVARARGSVLNTYKNAYYDPRRQDEVIAQVERDRGEEIDYSCFYNDRRRQDRGLSCEPMPTDAEIRAAVALSEYEWQSPPDMPTRKLYVNVDDPPGAIDFVMSVDNRYFSIDDTIAVARGMETVAVEAALDPTTPTGVAAMVGQLA
ncbi:MAG TPA: condensation domain-containing protein [Pseudonocardiaceae bacterium]|nr:condensation domain-containing protein [Pseudonocardiaceae bacterium]